MIELLQGVVGIVLFILILGVLVIVHELGHFITARLARIRVHEFGIGFPPRAKVLRSEGETLVTLNWLPIGGFVKLEGEDGDSDDPRSFGRSPLPVKELVLVSGVLMNLLLAFGIMSAIALFADDTRGMRFEMVQPGSPADTAGIKAGDTIVSLNGTLYSAYDFGPLMLDDLRADAGRTVHLGIDTAGGGDREVDVQLRSADQVAAGLGPLGVVNLSFPITSHRIPHDLVSSMQVGADRTVRATNLIANGLGQLVDSIVRRPTEPPPASGPVGIAAQVSEVFWQAGPVATLYLAAILSANLAVVNVLPFPPLDGGRMVVTLIKSIAGRRVSLRAEQFTYVVGFAFLFAFLVWITVFDVARQAGAIR